MTDIWVPGIDEIISLFEDYRDHQILINRLAEERASCQPRETASFTADVIHAAQEIPELQRLIERKEMLTEKIRSECQLSHDKCDKVEKYIGMIDDFYQRRVINEYYFRGQTMPQVAQQLRFCVSKCWEIRSDAFRIIVSKLATVGDGQL